MIHISSKLQAFSSECTPALVWNRYDTGGRV